NRRALELLDDCPEHLRGWEHGVLQRKVANKAFERTFVPGKVPWDRKWKQAFGLSPDGKLFACNLENRIGTRMWNVQEGREIDIYPQTYVDGAFSLDGKLFVGVQPNDKKVPNSNMYICVGGRKFDVWDLLKGEKIAAKQSKHLQSIYSLAFSS